MGCCASSEAAADKKSAANGSNKPGSRKELSKGTMREVSVSNNLSLNCKEGHPLDKYDVLDTLGTGGFAVVKRVRDKHTSENYAMKIISVTIDENATTVGFMEKGGGGRGVGGRLEERWRTKNTKKKNPHNFARDEQGKRGVERKEDRLFSP